MCVFKTIAEEMKETRDSYTTKIFVVDIAVVSGGRLLLILHYFKSMLINSVDHLNDCCNLWGGEKNGFEKLKKWEDLHS